MEAVCINLDRRPDRWAAVQRAMGPLLPPSVPLMRCSAIDGADVPVTTHLLARVSLYTRLCLDQAEWKVADHRLLHSWGAVACFLSHAKVWEQMVERGRPDVVLVLEDDCKPCPHKLRRFFQRRLPALLPNGSRWDVIILGHARPWRQQHAHTSSLECLQDAGEKWHQSHCYLLSQRGARHLLEHAFPISMPVDRYIQALALIEEPPFRGFLWNPSLASQATSLDSDVGHWHNLASVNWKHGFPDASMFLFLVWMVLVLAFIRLARSANAP